LGALQQQPPQKISAEESKLVAAGKVPGKSTTLEERDLHYYTEMAASLALIKPETATQVRLVKDFRNLIHPGRAIRKKQKCDRGTALAASAGLEFVIRDLTP